MLRQLLTQSQIDQIIPKNNSAKILQNMEHLVKKDSKLHHIYIVSRGMVVEKNGPAEVPMARYKHKRGDIVGLQNLHPFF